MKCETPLTSWFTEWVRSHDPLMTSYIPKRKKWTSDCWAFSYVAGRTADLSKQITAIIWGLGHTSESFHADHFCFWAASELGNDLKSRELWGADLLICVFPWGTTTAFCDGKSLCLLCCPQATRSNCNAVSPPKCPLAGPIFISEKNLHLLFR